MREHQVFQQPLSIPVAERSKRVPTPESFANVIRAPEIEVMPIASKRAGMPGWCTDATPFDEMPDVEWICGGVNSKTPRHAGIWRQGHLLHFGFQESPSEMNETGRALLVNAIVYAARFRDDRPIAVTPAGFGGREKKPPPRSYGQLERLLARPNAKTEFAEMYLHPGLLERVAKLDLAGLRAFLAEHRRYLRPSDDNVLLLVLDESALGRKMPLGDDAFFARGIELLRGGDRAVAALLARAAPAGPGVGGSADAWAKWWEANRTYLFFSETAGAVWLIDPLAQQRRTPSRDLRGPSRASEVRR